MDYTVTNHLLGLLVKNDFAKDFDSQPQFLYKVMDFGFGFNHDEKVDKVF